MSDDGESEGELEEELEEAQRLIAEMRAGNRGLSDQDREQLNEIHQYMNDVEEQNAQIGPDEAGDTENLGGCRTQ